MSRGLVGVLLVSAALFAAGAGYVTGRNAHHAVNRAALPLPAEAGGTPQGEHIAQQLSIQLVSGLTRSDGMSFWEFVEHRLLRLCHRSRIALLTSDSEAARPSGEVLVVGPFSVSPEGGTKELAYRWDVQVHVLAQNNCVPSMVWLGAVWTDTGEVEPLANGPRAMMLIGNPQTSGNSFPRHQLPEHGWLTDFRMGAVP